MTDDSFSLTTVGETNFTQVYATSDICTNTAHVRLGWKRALTWFLAARFTPDKKQATPVPVGYEGCPSLTMAMLMMMMMITMTIISQ